MTPTILVAIGALSLTALIQAAAVVIWGASLTQRVKRMEADIHDLKRVGERLASLEATLTLLFEQMKDMNASIRWMRSPAEYDGKGVK